MHSFVVLTNTFFYDRGVGMTVLVLVCLCLCLVFWVNGVNGVVDMAGFLSDEQGMQSLSKVYPQCLSELSHVELRDGLGLNCGQIQYIVQLGGYLSSFRPKKGKESIIRNAPSFSDLSLPEAEKMIYSKIFEEFFVKKVGNGVIFPLGLE